MALIGSLLMGWDHVLETISLSDKGWITSIEPLPFEEAIRYFGAKIPITKKEFYELDTKLRHRAFTVARLTELDAKNRIKERLLQVLKEGKTLAQFWEEGGRDELLKKAGFHSSNPWYWETVFRTNIQSAYNAGRRYGMKKNHKYIKYYEFVGIRDSRQTIICRKRNGIIRPADDPFWERNWPPLHFNCRSVIRPIYKDETFMGRITKDDYITELIPPQKGFGYDPLLRESFFKIPESMLKRAREYQIISELKELARHYGLKDFTIDTEREKGILSDITIKKYDDIGKVMEKIYKIKPDWFNFGYRNTEIVNTYSFMSTCRGTFKISSRKHKRFNFLPASDLKKALQKIQKGKSLSFNEEYSIEVLWHEILHNRTKEWFKPQNTVKLILYEAVNQIVARHTYEELLRILGGEPRHKKEIIEKGYGYSNIVNYIMEIVKKYKLDYKQIILDFQDLLLKLDQTYIDKIDNSILEILLKSCSSNKEKIIKTRYSYLKKWIEKHW